VGLLEIFRRTRREKEPDEPLSPRLPTTGSQGTASSRPQAASVYLASDRWNELLVLRADGFPPFRLVEHHRELWFAEEQTGLLVNVANRKLRPLGIWSGKARGMQHHEAIVKAADLRPRAGLALVREPDNEVDRNAIAIHSNAGPIGYVNKQMAAALARDLDAGVVLQSVSFGSGRWVAATPDVIDWLLRH